MTTATLGRPTREAERNHDLADELIAERAEGVALATMVLESTRFIEGFYDRPQVVMHHAGRLDHAARRFLRQRSSSVL